MPKGKAPGLSKISNEMLQHLGPNASDFLYDLICTCLETGKIPKKWRSAVSSKVIGRVFFNSQFHSCGFGIGYITAERHFFCILPVFRHVQITSYNESDALGSKCK